VFFGLMMIDGSLGEAFVVIRIFWCWACNKKIPDNRMAVKANLFMMGSMTSQRYNFPTFD